MPSVPSPVRKIAEVRVPPRDQDSFQNKSVVFFGEIVQAFRIPRSAGQIYGLLFANPTALSFSNIVVSLKISKGSTSQGLRLLKALGAVKSTTGSSSRRELFSPELSLKKLIHALLKENVEPLAGASATRIRELRLSAEQVSYPELRDFSLARVQTIEAWQKKMSLMLPVFKTFLGPTKQKDMDRE